MVSVVVGRGQVTETCVGAKACIRVTAIAVASVRMEAVVPGTSHIRILDVSVPKLDLDALINLPLNEVNNLLLERLLKSIDVNIVLLDRLSLFGRSSDSRLAKDIDRERWLAEALQVGLGLRVDRVDAFGLLGGLG